MIAENQKIVVVQPPPSIAATVSDRWIGKTGTLLKWEGDNWYTVEIDGKKLLLKDDEFRILK